MVIKYNIDISNKAILNNLERIMNQIFKLLPSREEGEDWETPLQNLIFEIVGMNKLLEDQTLFFSLLCKMESLKTFTEDKDFLFFRKMIFECLGICEKIKEQINSAE